MPPRHHYWTIILDGKPTAFRAHEQEELLPTLRQLQARHQDAVCAQVLHPSAALAALTRARCERWYFSEDVSEFGPSAPFGGYSRKSHAQA